jgi:hypothetical protein
LKKIDEADANGYATYDFKTGEIADIKDGYMVTFQVNKEIGARRDYTPQEYDDFVYEAMERSGSLPYLGTFGNAEISFNAHDLDTAMKMAIDYNQHSIYDVAAPVGQDPIIINPHYNREKNPTDT